MDNNKVILINGTNSNWYDQVIFILKPDNVTKIPVNLVGEAEKIINDYMKLKYSDKNKYVKPIENNHNSSVKTKTKPSIKSNKKVFNNFLNVSIFCCIVLIGILLYKIGF